jgi:glutamate synthase (NADPH/NADH) large chain
MTIRLTPPAAEGLYHPQHEHDACGVAMVARLDDVATHEVVEGAGPPLA